MEKVICKMDWLRSLKLGETKTGQFNSPQECHSLSTIIARYNVAEGRFRGVKISAVYNKVDSQVTITANKVRKHKK
jgi:hypothetical protein